MGDVVNLNQHRKRRRRKKDPGRHARAGLDKTTRNRIKNENESDRADHDGKQLNDSAPSGPDDPASG